MQTQSRKITVGLLTIEDLMWYVEVAGVRMLTDELKHPEYINLNNMYALAAKAMEEGTTFIAKDGDKCVGALGSILTSNLFNPDIKTLAEIFWYVLPEYRNTRAGAMLLIEFEKKAKEVADEATLSLLPSSTISVDTLEKRGFALAEFGFRKQLGE